MSIPTPGLDFLEVRLMTSPLPPHKEAASSVGHLRRFSARFVSLAMVGLAFTVVAGGCGTPASAMRRVT